MKFGIAQTVEDFKFIYFNRTVKRAINRINIKKIKRSIMSDGLLQPISVIIYEGVKYVIDGQHRLVALAELGMDIPYYVCREVEILDDMLSAIIEAQKTRTWKPEDYLYAFVAVKNSHYIMLKDIINKFEIKSNAYSLVLTAIGNGKAPSADFKSGKLTITNRTRVEKVLNHYFQLTSLDGFPSGVKSGRGVISMICDLDYNHTKLVKKVAQIIKKRPDYFVNDETVLKGQLRKIIVEL